MLFRFFPYLLLYICL